MRLRNSKGDLLLEFPFVYVVTVLLALLLFLGSAHVAASARKATIKAVAEGVLLSFLEDLQNTLNIEGYLEEGENQYVKVNSPVEVTINTKIVSITSGNAVEVYQIYYIATVKCKPFNNIYLNNSVSMCQTQGV